MKYELNSGLVIEIDEENLEKVNKYTWFETEEGYIRANFKSDDGKRFGVLLHRYLTNAPEDMVVDHKDRNPLNNKIENLRICTNAQNSRNRSIHTDKESSKFKGVYFNKKKKVWESAIGFEGSQIYLGSFDSEENAAVIYNRKAIELFGEFALLNPIEDDGSEVLSRTETKIRNGIFLGVSKKGKRFSAKVKFNKKDFHLGTFDTPEEAALERDKFVLENKMKTRLNFPGGSIC